MHATATIPKAPILYPVTSRSWTRALLEDLEPTPGRLSSALRIVLASVIALLLMEILQMPFIAIGMYFIFLIGRDSPAVSLRTSLFSFGIVTLAIVVELAVVIVSDNDPLVRLLSVAVVTFVAGMIVVTTNTPSLGSSFGLIYGTVIALWELHAPADRLVKTSLYFVGTFGISLGCAVAVEYLFGDRHPADKLQEQRRIRYLALEAMFRAYAEDAPLEQRIRTARVVSRIAVAGQTGMIQLYNTIVERNLDTRTAHGSLPIALRPRLTMLAQLMDVSAAFGLQHLTEIDEETRLRCARIADACRQIIPGINASTARDLVPAPTEMRGLLDRVEAALHGILTMPTDPRPQKHRELVSLPSSKVPFFIPGAIRNRDNVAFGLKISLCATLCYILYHALDWNGTSTSVTTVLVAGLSSTAATKQRLIFRLLGSVIGGLLLGIGATVFLFPHMDSLTSLVALEAAVAFACAWVAAGPKFSYIGLQLAFSFYIVAYEGFSAPTELAPARDRFAGILIALAIMWVVFDQLWPVRTTTVMRRSFASVLHLGADLIHAMDSDEPHVEILRQADQLRDRLGKTVAGLRSLNGSVPYEFGTRREDHIQTGDMILRATITATSLFWNQFAVLHSEDDEDYRADPSLREMRRKIAERLLAMSQAISRDSAIEVGHGDPILPAPCDNPHYAEYARDTVARFEELEAFTLALNTRH